MYASASAPAPSADDPTAAQPAAQRTVRAFISTPHHRVCPAGPWWGRPVQDHARLHGPGPGLRESGQLAARNVDAVLSGSGRIVTRATDTLQASVPASATTAYTANRAHVTTSATGSGTITRR